MAQVQLSTLRSRVRELADMVNTTFVTDGSTSLDAFINAGLQALHDKILDSMGDDALGVSSQSLSPTLASRTATVALPSDFLRLLGVELTVGGEVIDLHRFNFKERNSLRGSWLYAPRDVPQYRLEGANLRFNGPDGAYSGTLYYAPAATLLAAGTDACNYPNGAEQWAVLYAAILALTKEESDASALMTMLQLETERIETMASRRHAGSPPQTVDIERRFTDGGSPWEG